MHSYGLRYRRIQKIAAGGHYFTCPTAVILHNFQIINVADRTGTTAP